MNRDITGKLTITHGIKNNNEVKGLKDLLDNNDKSCSAKKFDWKNWAGGYGAATISLQQLITRANLGMAAFSEDITKYTHAMYLGTTVLLVPALDIDWIFYSDYNFNINKSDWENAKKWTHPAHLILKSGHKLVQSIKRCPRCKWRRVHYRPPLNLLSKWYEKEDFQNYSLFSYRWSTIDINNCIGLPGSDVIGDSIWWQNTWMKQCCPKWMDRATWDSKFLSANNDSNSNFYKKWFEYIFNPSEWNTTKGNWGPFCPPMYGSENCTCLVFFYKFKFKFGGHAFSSFQPGDAANEVVKPPDCTQKCAYCIRNSDLDKDGFIKPWKLRKLIKPHHKNQLEKHLKRRRKRPSKVTFSEEIEIYP